MSLENSQEVDERWQGVVDTAHSPESLREEWERFIGFQQEAPNGNGAHLNGNQDNLGQGDVEDALKLLVQRKGPLFIANNARQKAALCLFDRGRRGGQEGTDERKVREKKKNRPKEAFAGYYTSSEDALSEKDTDPDAALLALYAEEAKGEGFVAGRAAEEAEELVRRYAAVFGDTQEPEFSDNAEYDTSLKTVRRERAANHPRH